MNPLDSYLNRVARHLVGVSAEVRRDVLRELRSNIEAQALEEGEDVAAIIERMGAPREAALSYKQLYGYSPGVKLLALVGSALLAFLSLPFSLGISDPLGTVWLSNAALVVLIILLVGVALRIGRRTAVVSGIAAAVVRLVGLGAGYVIMAPGLSTDPVASLAFILTTLAIAIVGLVAPSPSPTGGQG